MFSINKNKTIYIARHGQTPGNKKGEWIGARSVDKLNAYGKTQAKENARILKEVGINASRIYSGPTPRALQHAEILQKHLGLSIEKLNSLTEINLGILEDRTRKEGLRLAPEEIEDWNKNLKEFNPPLGESALEAQERFTEIVELLCKNDSRPDLLIVSHGVVIKLFLTKILGASLETGETKIKVPWTTHGTITVVKFNGKDFKFKRVIENKFPDSKRIAEFG